MLFKFLSARSPKNAGQISAINHNEGPMLVLAGPGSGKTYTLVRRIDNLVSVRKVKPSEILVITFTKAAASEMRERYLKHAGLDSTEVTFGTFHSVFLRILSENGVTSGCTLATEEQCLKIIRNVARERLKDEAPSDMELMLTLDEIGRMKNGMKSSYSYAEILYKDLEREFERLRLIDYDDMMIKMLALLRNNEHVLASLRKRFRYLLVDEFQDINRVQYEIVKLLSAPQNNVFAVGDDDQSIYGFRGSDPEIMKRFPNDFPGTKIVNLNINYRSSREIVKTSLKLINNNKNRYKKKLKSNSGRFTDVYTAFPANLEAEAEFIRTRLSVLNPDYTVGILGRTQSAVNEIRNLLCPQGQNQVCSNTATVTKNLNTARKQ
ncbi:MAG: UvrD-helicase domain-containing protein [Eubacteriales bacterium]|nr:UvrD-helicase domain-containing protein [Eubacteriales bacterium]